MSAASLLVREELRRRPGTLVALTVLLTVGFGATLVAFEVAERTDEAYPRYLRRASVGELAVNPVLATSEVRELIAGVPGVRSVASDSLLLAGPVDPSDPNQPMDVPFLQVRSSTDGRYVDQDRPVVTSGRMIRSGHEAFLSEEAAQALDAEVGSRIDLAFLESADDVAITPTAIPEPIGREQVEIVGIGVFHDEVLPDELIPRQKLLIPADLAAPYDCDYRVDAALDGANYDEVVEQVIPAGCSVSYRYYSLRLHGGDRAAPRVARELAERFDDANDDLPATLTERDVRYQLIPSFRSEDRDRVAESLLPAATSLRVFGAAIGIVTFVLALMLATRVYRRRHTDQLVWEALGMPRRARSRTMFLPVAAALVAGVVGGVVAAWVASPMGPIASGRIVEPGPARGLGPDAWLATLVAAVAMGAGTLVAAHLSTSSRTVITSSPRSRRTIRSIRPAVNLGLGTAWRSRGSTALLGGAILAVGAVTAAVVFSAGLGLLLDEPARYGWPFDAAVLVNAGYGPGGFDDPDVDRLANVRDTLRRPEVKRWGAASITNGASVDGLTLPLFSPRVDTGDIFTLPTTAGRLPGPDEVALGTATARRLGIDIGDQVEVRLPYGSATARVSGTVVLPALGPLEADRMSPGVGVVIGPALFESILDQAAAPSGITGAELADDLAGFVAIDLAPGADPNEFFRSIDAAQATWLADSTQVHDLAHPVRPPTVVDASALRRLPASLAAALSIGVTFAVVVGIASLTRSRRRELAVLRALGADARLLRATVVVHSLAVVAVGVAVGLPLGLLAGNAGYGAFARSIGVATTTAVPAAGLVVIGLGAIAVGLAAGFWPAGPIARWIGQVETDRSGPFRS